MDRTVLTETQLSRLLDFLADSLSGSGGCDHTLRHAREWTATEDVDWDDMVDALEASGAFCDCEVVMNAPDRGALVLPAQEDPLPAENAWRIPDTFEHADASQRFSRTLIASHRPDANCHSQDGALLAPAPKGTKARKRVRRSVHFFVGLTDGLPNEVGFVAESQPRTAAEFAKEVRESGHPELSRFGPREAAYFLSRLASLAPATPVGAHFMAVMDVSRSKPEQLRIHKVFLRHR